jgi:WD40 repeat protein/serine/threonine protein kinase
VAEIAAVEGGSTVGAPAMSPTVIRTCRKCGAKLFGEAKFCSACLLETALGSPAEDDVDLADAEQRPPPVMTQFGDYELLEEIGRGGQGVVYRARQKSLNRVVALKVIALGPWATETHLKRFRREAEAAASLEHPRIVPIYEIGERDGCCYFSMQLVEGGQLDELVSREPLDVRRAAEVIVKLARTVHYAHQRGVLHRDIKPGNILLDENGEPHLTDFGLARLVEKESTVTRTMEVLGTPSYMAPEQAAGQTEQLTVAADVYGLGGALYHLLTGQPPFGGGTTYETIRLVLETEPRHPSLFNRDVDRDLETICLKCLQKEPSKRYGSAKSLADDLDRFLANEPILSRRVSRMERVWRWCKRKPVIAALTAGLVLSAIVGFTGILWQLHRAQHEESITRRNLYCADMNLAYEAWEEGNLQRAQSLLRAHLPEPGREDLRGFEWRYLWQLCRDESRFTFTNVHFAHGLVHPSDRGALVPAAESQTVITASGNTLRWLDVYHRREVRMVNVGTDLVTPLATARNKPGLVAYYTDKIHCISPNGENLLRGGVVHEWCSTIALSPDGSLLASGGVSRTERVPVRLWDARSGAQIAEYTPAGEAGGATSVAFSPDGKYLVCSTNDTRIRVLDATTLRQLTLVEGAGTYVNSLTFDHTGTRLASAYNDSQIIIWSFPECHEITRFAGHRGAVIDVTFAPDGQTLASAGRDHTVRVWDLVRPGTHTILRGHRDGVRSVLFSSDGKELYSSSDDGTVKIWQLPAAESNDVLRHGAALAFVAFSPDGKLVAAVDNVINKTAVIWDVASRRQWERTFGQHSKDLQRLAFSPDGKFLVTAGLDDEVQIWNLAENKLTFRFPKARGRFWIGFHPRKPILAIGADTVRFWDVETGRETNLLINPPSYGIEKLAFSTDGKWIAFGMGNGIVSVWNLATGQESHSFHEHAGHVSHLCFAHDSTLLASAGDDYRIVFYDVWRQRALKSIEAHTHLIWGLAFAPDDKTLVSTSWDGTIKFWSMANQQLALTLAPGGTLGVAFSPDMNLMATCGFDGTLRFWPAPSLAEIDAAEKRAQR